MPGDFQLLSAYVKRTAKEAVVSERQRKLETDKAGILLKSVGPPRQLTA